MIANEYYNSNFNFNDSLEIELCNKLNDLYQGDILFSKIETNGQAVYSDLNIEYRGKVSKGEVKNLQQFHKYNQFSVEITDHRGNFILDKSNTWINTEKDNDYLLYTSIVKGDIKEVYIIDFKGFREYIINLITDLNNIYFRGHIHKNIYIDDKYNECIFNYTYKIVKNREDSKYNLYISKDNKDLQKYIKKHIVFSED